MAIAKRQSTRKCKRKRKRKTQAWAPNCSKCPLQIEEQQRQRHNATSAGPEAILKRGAFYLHLPLGRNWSDWELELQLQCQETKCWISDEGEGKGKRA